MAWCVVLSLHNDGCQTQICEGASYLSFLSSLEATRSNQRFIFVERELSWSDAQLYCRKLYTDLASVRDEKENQEIQHLAKNRSVWIGLYRSGKCYMSLFLMDGYLRRLMREPLPASYFFLDCYYQKAAVRRCRKTSTLVIPEFSSTTTMR